MGNIELRIDGYNYKLSEEKIQPWLELYGKVESEIKEEAILREDMVVETGMHLVKICLKKLIPNILPMHGLKIRLSHRISSVANVTDTKKKIAVKKEPKRLLERIQRIIPMHSRIHDQPI